MVKTLDDSQLLRLAADPRTRLFADLRGAASWGPMVLVVSLLPIYLSTIQSGLNDAAAGWGLRALDLLTAAHVDGWLQPGLNGYAGGLVHQPPLGTWMLAISVDMLGTHSLLAWRVLSLAATTCLIVFSDFLGRRIGGASFALVVIACICCHPVTLQLATGIGPESVGLLLITIAVWGFLGHLAGPASLVSRQLLVGAIAWGLSLLTVGPVAVTLLIPLGLHVWLLRGHRDSVDTTAVSESHVRNVWIGVRSFLVFLATGLSFSGWWQIMMQSNHGMEFWNSWWTGHVSTNSPLDWAGSFGSIWLRQNEFVCGFLVIGLFRAVGELKSPSSEVSRRHCQFTLLWWLTALFIRWVFDLPAFRGSVLMNAWDGFLLIPSALLVAGGIKAIVLRQTHPLVEALLIVSTLALATWMASGSAILTVIALLAGIGVLVLLPSVTARVRRYAEGWKDRDWRRVVQTALVLLLFGHLAIGFVQRPKMSGDSAVLVELHDRMAPLPEMRRISLMTLSDSIPESLSFLVHSRWPKAQLTVKRSWDAILANVPDPKSTETKSTNPAVGEVVVAWTRRDSRLQTEITTVPRFQPFGDSVRFRGRKLAIYTNEPLGGR
jgi:hypothetical protein